MRRLIHVSDLHFGRARPELLGPLVEIVNRLAPEVVAVSGDFTQRARNHQFEAARRFLDALEAPWLAVPGNHDVPLDNVALRAISPYRRYKRWISRDLEPRFEDEEIVVVGVNTVDPSAWQRGRISRSDIKRACRVIGDKGHRHTRIIVVHHPFRHLPNEPKALMKGAGAGMQALAECGVDIVLSGHLHAWRAEPVATRIGGSVTLQIQAGTGLSTRQRGEENDFNLLTIEDNEVKVERYAALEDGSGFAPGAPLAFRRRDGRWRHADEEKIPSRRSAGQK
jgi:3',5'-cyclic AMP phosphodiesterase CpdA